MNFTTILPLGVLTIVMVGATLGVYYLSISMELLQGNRVLLEDEIAEQAARGKNQVAYNDEILNNMIVLQNLTIKNQELIKMNQELIKNITGSNLNLTVHNRQMLDDTNEDVNKLMELFNQTSGKIAGIK